MSLINNGQYRMRSVSIPSLVDIDEHVDDDDSSHVGKNDVLNTTEPAASAVPQKPPRRSSLVLGLFSSKSDKNQKRRSSIAVFLRRDKDKVSLSIAMKSN